jgi:hypothetical protein
MVSHAIKNPQPKPRVVNQGASTFSFSAIAVAVSGKKLG